MSRSSRDRGAAGLFRLSMLLLFVGATIAMSRGGPRCANAADGDADLATYDLSFESLEADTGMQLKAELANPVVAAGEAGRAYLRVGMRGSGGGGERAPVNVCFVIDKSGSMDGNKIEDAREAALMGVDQLGDSDIVSVVAYDSTVSVPLPPTRVRNRDEIRRAIQSIRASGNTALFAGVSQGASQLRRFIDANHVNRLILLSDGLANVGPSSPGELSSLGRSLAREGITVSTVGLGLDYNEDLMVQLAQGGNGFHYFAQESSDLAAVFRNELGNARSVVAQQVTIRIRCADGVRPVKVHGRDAVFEDGAVVVDLHQLYAGFENYVLVELELPAVGDGLEQPVADVTASYRDLNTERVDTLFAGVSVRGSRSTQEVSRELNSEVLVALAEYVSTERYRKALDLRDNGQANEARELLQDNAAYLRDQANVLGADQLHRLEQFNLEASEELEGDEWLEQRKRMRQRDYMATQNNVY
jgi:Ca-activated chloride channel homolog